MLSHSLVNNYDTFIVFHSVENIPKLSGIDYENLYFVAQIDHKIIYTSTILGKKSTAIWEDEEWIVRNIPGHAKLSIELFYKDDTKVSDHCYEKFEIDDLLNNHSPVSGQHKGRFYLQIHMTKSSKDTEILPQYTFDGPCRFDNYNFSTSAGHFSVWKIHLRRVPFFFHSSYCESTRDLFNYQPKLLDALKAMKKTTHTFNGRLKNTEDLWRSVFTDRTTNKIHPRIYNYIIDDYSWQFSETGHQFFGSSTNKHALLSHCSNSIRFAGEFHPRPIRGWHRWNDSEWELVFDNASGTYSPDSMSLDILKQLFLFNFPNLNIVTYNYKDPLLQYSIEQLEVIARSNRYKRHEEH